MDLNEINLTTIHSYNIWFTFSHWYAPLKSNTNNISTLIDCPVNGWVGW
ncbi:hypothetical protein CKOHBEJN_04230 [Aeromonas hydrophila]